MQQHQVLVGQLAHDAGGLQEGLRGRWGQGAAGRRRVGAEGPPAHLGAVAVAAVHHLEHHGGLVELVILLVPLDALVDVGEGTLPQALALPWDGMLGWEGPPWPPAPPTPSCCTRMRLSGSILWNVSWLGLRRGAGGELGGRGRPLRTISRLDFSGGGGGGGMRGVAVTS